jgi:glucosylceramidase
VSTIELWLTDLSHDVFLRKQNSVPVANVSDALLPTIHVDSGTTYQTLEGFGFSLTGGSALLINRLDSKVKDSLLQELFTTAGIGVSYLRLTVGAADLSERSYSYNDLSPGATDPELAGFDIMAGDQDVIPLLTQILAINPDLAIMASPWSAPPWMKTNGKFQSGFLRPDCYAVYARYLVKYLHAMRERGIHIRAVTVQNEPMNFKNEPSMLMSASEQAEFIKHHLGPAIRAAGLSTEIFCWDHNCDLIEYPFRILNDPGAREYVAGVAWHLYGGDISALSKMHAAHPDKKMYFTEQWVGADGNFAGDLKWHLRNVLVGSLRNWSQVVLEWNLAGDPNHGPHTEGGEQYCVGALTIDSDEVVRNVAYYIIGHVAKFVPPGSVRIASNLPLPLHNVAFLTPDRQIVLIVENDAYEPQSFSIACAGQPTVTTTLAGGAVGTYIWSVL